MFLNIEGMFNRREIETDRQYIDNIKTRRGIYMFECRREL
jgi:hypothetical protein